MRSLAVVVLNWNGIDDTLALLATLARCRVPDGWSVSVLVVDNGSTDGSVARLGAAHPQVETLALPANLRFAGGNNVGLRRALEQGADAILLLNNDTEADPALYERLLLALEQDPMAGAAAPLIYFAPPTDRIWYAGGQCVVGLGWVAHRGLREQDLGQYRTVEPTGYLTGCCLLAPRAVWERVGLLDEGYHLYAEDADWSVRARRAGYRLLFVPTARLWHKVSASSGAASPFKFYQRTRGNLRLLARHARGLERFTWPLGFGAYCVALGLSLLAKGHAAAAMAIPRAWADALAGRPAAEGPR